MNSLFENHISQGPRDFIVFSIINSMLFLCYNQKTFCSGVIGSLAHVMNSCGYIVLYSLYFYT